MPTAKKRKHVKADKAEVKVHLGKTERLAKKQVELVILLPPAVAKNLYLRLHNRFGARATRPKKQSATRN